MKFGVREICDVVFKTTAANQTVGGTTFTDAGTPVLYLDTAKTSSLEQAATTVYATGGKGNTRLLAWEGEKTMTFTVEDAMLSPLGLAVLTNAGLVDASVSEPVWVHATAEVTANSAASVTLKATHFGADNVYLYGNASPVVAFYATEVDNAGAIIGAPAKSAPTGSVVPVDASTGVTITNWTGGNSASWTSTTKLIVDVYIRRTSASVKEITIAAEDFGGYYYVEATTLFRDQATGVDMPAEIIIPLAKVQSNFTFSMAATGDPSTFSFVMDAFPGTTKFGTEKVLAAIQILGDYEYGS